MGSRAADVRTIDEWLDRFDSGRFFREILRRAARPKIRTAPSAILERALREGGAPLAPLGYRGRVYRSHSLWPLARRHLRHGIDKPSSLAQRELCIARACALKLPSTVPHFGTSSPGS